MRCTCMISDQKMHCGPFLNRSSYFLWLVFLSFCFFFVFFCLLARKEQQECENSRSGCEGLFFNFINYKLYYVLHSIISYPTFLILRWAMGGFFFFLNWWCPDKVCILFYAPGIIIDGAPPVIYYLFTSQTQSTWQFRWVGSQFVVILNQHINREACDDWRPPA